MTPQAYLISLTGLSAAALFGSRGDGRDGMVTLRQTSAGLSIINWSVPDVAQPSDADLRAAISPPPQSADTTTVVADRKSVLKTYAADVRYAKQTGGMTIGGMPIDTSDYSRGMIEGACSYLNNDPSVTTVQYKGAAGWVDIPRATMLAIGVSLGAYVQACFAAERAIDAAIDDATITTTAAVDDWAWPSTTT